MTTLPEPWGAYEAQIASANTEAEIAQIELSIFGRKQGALTEALKGLGAMTPDERKAKGAELNQIKHALETAIADRRGGLDAGKMSALADEDRLDVTLRTPERQKGHLHLIPEFIRQVEDVFGRMGFDVARGPEMETEENNFSLLNIPADHPARDAQDTFWIDSKDPVVLRTHTSPVQIRYMQTHKPPFRMICPGRVYRKDSDATHSPMFHQFEGLMIGKDISLANMKAVMETAIKALVGENLTFRFRSGYFQFVEPGLEVDMRFDDDSGKPGRWMEIVGCGMVHPNVLKNVGIDPKEWQGFAFGFGVERMLMIRHKIPDLRSFYQGDLRFLSQF